MLSSKLILLASVLGITSADSFGLKHNNGEICFNVKRKTGWVTTCVRGDNDKYQIFASAQTPAKYQPDGTTKYYSGIASIGHVYLYGTNAESGSFDGYPSQEYQCTIIGSGQASCDIA